MSERGKHMYRYPGIEVLIYGGTLDYTLHVYMYRKTTHVSMYNKMGSKHFPFALSWLGSAWAWGK